MSKRVTAEEVKKAMVAGFIRRVELWNCDRCARAIYYQREIDQLYMHGGCGCEWQRAKLVSWQEAADYINNQSEALRERVARDFGITRSLVET
jgi:hypothetical protein